MTEIVRDAAGYVLPVGDQPWFDGASTPKDLIRAWEQADREDWIRFDAARKTERDAEAKPDTLVRRLLTAFAINALVVVVWVAFALAVGGVVGLVGWLIVR